MDHSNAPANDGAFPALFVVLSTFLGGVIWLCVMLNSVTPH